MKKIVVFVLLCAFSTVLMAAEKIIVKNVVFTVGKTYLINPIADCGFGPYNNIGYYQCVSYSDNNLYSISNSGAFNITTIKNANGSSGGNDQPYYYYTFQITPTETGSYTFYEYIQYQTIHGTSYYGSVTYNITVVDLTNIFLPSTLALQLGDTYTFSPTFIDSQAENTIIWQSSNTAVATIDENGILTANGIGESTVSCIADNGVSAQCVVTVNPVLVSNVSLNETEAELTVGEKLELEATIAPDNATDKGVTWSSSNQAVAVVNESGQVTAVGSGICNITAMANDGSGITGSCLITVLGNVMFCEDFGAVPGATVMLPVQLNNADAIQGFQFKLVLPEGVSIQTDAEGKLMATLTERASTQGLEGANQGNGVYQFVYTSTNRILGTSDAIVNIPVVVANTVAVGQYDVVVKDVELVKYGTSSQIHHGDRTATLTIKEMTLGDVNGDGRISVADAISIINYVLGRTPVSFIAIAADVNNDGDISLADAVATVDIILGGNNAGARAFVRSILNLDPQ